MPVTFKGSKNGIDIWLDADAEVCDILDKLKEKLSSAKGLFSGTKTPVRFAGRVVSNDEEKAIRTLITDVLGEDSVTFNPPPRVVEKNSYHYGIVRSGQSLYSKADLIVFGDANPGSELLAEGSIIVMGSLRGLAHAGYNGDKSAVVSAVYLRPIQLRIADVYAHLPDKVRKGEIKPELAYIKDDEIRLKALSR